MQPFVPPKKIDKAGLIAMRKQQALASATSAQSVSSQSKPEDAMLARAASFIKPEDAPERLRIVFDDSGSMAGVKMSNAKEGVVEFLRNCTPNQTAVAVHLLNNEPSWNVEGAEIPPLIKDSILTSDLLMLASEIKSEAVDATDGTPLYEKLVEALEAMPRATRLIAFSDGVPRQSRESKFRAFKLAKEFNIPIDTIYISMGYSDTSAVENMKEIAEATGGYFLDLSKGDFKKGLKYLAPTKRLMLADSSFKAAVERGQAQ
jgi:Mg-chelatase subunit ChlD